MPEPTEKKWSRKRPVLSVSVAQDTVDFYTILAETVGITKGRLMDETISWLVEDYGIEGLIERALKK